MKRAAVYALLGLVLALSGCGGSDKTVVETTTTGPPSVTAESVVESYYDAVNSGDYQTAWADFSPTLQRSEGGYQQWRHGYDDTVSTRLISTNLVSASPTQSVVAVQLRATATDACGDTVPQSYRGTWTLRTDGSSPLTATDLNLDQTSGGSFIENASDCPVTTPTDTTTTDTTITDTTTTETSCDPNYSGACLDPNSSDYDCAGGTGNGPDYTGPVQVVGNDHFGLDRDGDGYACE